MPSSPVQDPILSIRPLTRACAGWVQTRQAGHYVDTYGFDAQIAADIAGALDRLLTSPDPIRDRGWIAWLGARRAGSVLAEGIGDETVRLRLLYVDDVARGRGIGRALLSTLVAHGEAIGAARITLATHAEHGAARSLYAASGFVLATSERRESYGRLMTVERWEKPLRQSRAALHSQGPGDT